MHIKYFEYILQVDFSTDERAKSFGAEYGGVQTTVDSFPTKICVV